MADSISTLSWLSEILELRDDYFSCIEWKGVWKTFNIFHNSTQQCFPYYKTPFYKYVLQQSLFASKWLNTAALEFEKHQFPLDHIHWSSRKAWLKITIFANHSSFLLPSFFRRKEKRRKETLKSWFYVMPFCSITEVKPHRDLGCVTVIGLSISSNSVKQSEKSK